MRGDDRHPDAMFRYVAPEQRVPADHPLRAIRTMVDTALRERSPEFERLYPKTGRPSIPPEKLLRALLLQMLYAVRSERQLMEQLDYNLLFRWFVGLSMDDPVWDPTVFTKNRERLLRGDIARAFFERVLAQAPGRHLLSGEHFTGDGTLIEAWAGLKSFKQKGTRAGPPDDQLSRLSRDVGDTDAMIKRLRFFGVRVIAVSDGLDTGDEHTKISVTVKSLVNELYLDDLRKTTKRGLDGQFLKGYSTGGRTYGYRSEPVYEPTSCPDPRGRPIPAGYRLTVVPEEAAATREIFRLFREGHG